MATEKLAFFLQDGASMCESLGNTLLRLDEEPESADLINQAFRYVHSIKSEASFLKLDSIGAVAHGMEGRLEQFRRDGVASREVLKTLQEMREQLEEMLYEVEKQSSAETESEELAVEQPEPFANDAGREPEQPRQSRDMEFNEFERRLLREAWERGERFYRLVCTIEESAPIKYAKAYLVVNNLEILANVIRTVPPLEPHEDEEFREFQVYFTSNVDEEEVREAIDLDQIERVTISEIGFESLTVRSLPERSEERRTPVEEPYVRIEAERLDEIIEYVQEMKLLLHRLAGSDEVEVTSLKELVPGLERLVGELRRVPLQRELRHIPRFARDLARRLDKQVKVEISGSEILVDRRMLVLLSEVLLHLVRNAVDHGIEQPIERELRGKNPVGTIEISAVEKGGQLIIRVADDGAGVDEAAVVAKARELGMMRDGDASPVDLLSILVQPGFSTRDEASSISGRGVGLDLVHERVTRVLGGEMRLTRRTGQGVVFTLMLPSAASYMTILLLRCGRQTIGLPARHVQATHRAGDLTLAVDEAGRLHFGGMAVLRLQELSLGRVNVLPGTLPQEALPAQGHLLVVNHLGKRVCLYADELLFERDIPEGRMVLGEEVGAGLYAVSIGEKRADFLFARLP